MLPSTAPVFVLEQVTVRRGGALLLDALSCSVDSGVCTALVGPSGAGKTTVLRLLNRLEEPSSGTVRVHGRPLTEIDAPVLRRRIQLVSQHPVLLTGYVLDDLRVGRPDLDDRQAAVLLDRVGLRPTVIDRPTAGLSGGEAQRVCLARALALDPEVLLLDEPTSALDPAGVRAVEGTVRDLVAAGLTVVLVSHNTPQARRVADQVLVLRDGRLADSGPVQQITYLKEGT